MKRLSIWLLVLMFGAAVTGCATAQPSLYAYSKPGDAAEQFNRDQFECQAWAKQQSGYDPTKDSYSRAYMACMTGRGYMIGQK